MKLYEIMHTCLAEMIYDHIQLSRTGPFQAHETTVDNQELDQEVQMGEYP